MSARLTGDVRNFVLLLLLLLFSSIDAFRVNGREGVGERSSEDGGKTHKKPDDERFKPRRFSETREGPYRMVVSSRDPAPIGALSHSEASLEPDESVNHMVVAKGPSSSTKETHRDPRKPRTNTMSYDIYNHFRPLDKEVPGDHILPFLDFGRKLPTTPLNAINSIEGSSTPRMVADRTSRAPGEDDDIDEEMDVSVVKAPPRRVVATPSKGLVQMREPIIDAYLRKRIQESAHRASSVDRPSNATDLQSNESGLQPRTVPGPAEEPPAPRAHHVFRNLELLNKTKFLTAARPKPTYRPVIFRTSFRRNLTKLVLPPPIIRVVSTPHSYIEVPKIVNLSLSANDTIAHDPSVVLNVTTPGSSPVPDTTAPGGTATTTAPVRDTTTTSTTVAATVVPNTAARRATAATTAVVRDTTATSTTVAATVVPNIAARRATAATTTVVRDTTSGTSPVAATVVPDTTASTTATVRDTTVAPNTIATLISSPTAISQAAATTPSARSTLPLDPVTTVLPDTTVSYETPLPITTPSTVPTPTVPGTTPDTAAVTAGYTVPDTTLGSSAIVNPPSTVTPIVLGTEMPIASTTTATPPADDLPATVTGITVDSSTSASTDREFEDSVPSTILYFEDTTRLEDEPDGGPPTVTTASSTTTSTSTTTRKPLMDARWSTPVWLATERYNSSWTSRTKNTSSPSPRPVGPLYRDTLGAASYLLALLGLVPLVLGILVLVRQLLRKTRKKVLDESEYSSEYNRSPLPTKLPRLPPHINWENEKNVAPPPAATAAPTSPSSSQAAKSWEFPRDKLRLQTVLGQGNFGQVWKAEADDISGHEGLTRLVAVKTVKEAASPREKEDLLRELGIMQQLGAHPNVVTLLGCCTEKEPYLLIMEYVMYGKMLTFLREHSTKAHYFNFSELSSALVSRDLTVFAYCIARGMEYLESKGIIHRDLAARNILVDHNKLCKIADFGMSRSVRNTGQIYEQRPTKGALPIRWMAPESLELCLFSHQTDVWSFGVLIWEIITLGWTPYWRMGGREVMRRVRGGYRLQKPGHTKGQLYAVAADCWAQNPSRRPTFTQIKHRLAALLADHQTAQDVDLEALAISRASSK